jgi:hypothetical protein
LKWHAYHPKTARSFNSALLVLAALSHHDLSHSSRTRSCGFVINSSQTGFQKAKQDQITVKVDRSPDPARKLRKKRPYCQFRDTFGWHPQLRNRSILRHGCSISKVSRAERDRAYTTAAGITKTWVGYQCEEESKMDHLQRLDHPHKLVGFRHHHCSVCIFRV